MKKFQYKGTLLLELGGVIENPEIGYHTYGTMNAKGDNVVWVCHALTANSDVADWWPNTVEKGRFLDPERYFIVCANVLGSQYGSTGPLSINPQTGRAYYQDFPLVTVRDIVRCHQLLAEHLNIKQVFALMGSSLGGFQAMEWAIMEPLFCKHLLLIATATRAMPWATALNESQRMAIEVDPSFGELRDDAGANGLKVARSIALLSYRGQPAYDATQQETEEKEKVEGFRASSYQRYQGEKLARRFSAYTYHAITRTLDTHNIGRGRGSREEALSLINAHTTVVAVSSDILFPVSEHHYMLKHIPGACYAEIDSPFGHDGFLVESDQLNRIILEVFAK